MKSPKTVTSKNEPPAWLQPYFKDLVGNASAASKKPFEQYGGDFIAPENADQTSAYAAIRQRAMGGDPIMDTANSSFQRLMAGGSNPELQNMIDASSRDVTDKFQKSIVPSLAGQFASGGAFGGSAYQQQMGQAQQGLAQELGDISSGYRFNDYNAQQDRQLQGLGLAGSLSNAQYNGANQLLNIGNQQQQTGTANNQAQYMEFLRGQGWDAQQLGLLGQALGTAGGAYSNQTNPNPNYQSTGQQLGGLGLAALGMFM